jgi:hypothetical protein
VTSPRRYRLALLAFPGAARRRHASDLLGVLRETDADRGRPSWREATYLLSAGLGLQLQRATGTFTPSRLIIVAATSAAACALAPGSQWALRSRVLSHGHSYFVVEGPTPILRWALLAGSGLALATVTAQRGFRARAWISLLAGAAGLGLSLLSLLHRPGVQGGPSATNVWCAAFAGGVLGSGVLVASLALSRLPMVARVRCVAGCLVLACLAALTAAVQADPLGNLGSLAPWQLGPAGLLTAWTVLLGWLAMLAGRRRHGDVRRSSSRK